MSRYEHGPDGTWSEWVYGLLLRLYPRRFREEYGEPMAQLFRDQWKQARLNRTVGRVVMFWLRVLADTGLTASRERLSVINSTMSQLLTKHLLRNSGLTFATTFAVMFVLLSATITTAVGWWIPVVYQSTARVAVEKQMSRATGLDPYLIQTEFERITSRQVLNTVITELELNAWLTQQGAASTRLTAGDSYQLLRRMVHVRQTRNTSLLEVSVSDTDRVAAAQIANKIVEVYRRTSEDTKARSEVQIVDTAEPGMRPVSPNLYLSLFLGFLASVAFAVMVTLVLRFMRPGRADALQKA